MGRLTYAAMLQCFSFLFSGSMNALAGSPCGVAHQEHTGGGGRTMSGEDFVPFPPPTREVVSPNGQFSFVISSPAVGKTKDLSTGQLFRGTSRARKLVWEKKLPQEQGPRYALVGNQGEVALFDEWNNVKSRYAVVLINVHRNFERSHDFDAVATVLGEPVARIVEQARVGWWLQGPPTVDDSGASAYAMAAGKCLAIDLNTGNMTLR